MTLLILMRSCSLSEMNGDAGMRFHLGLRRARMNVHLVQIYENAPA